MPNINITQEWLDRSRAHSRAQLARLRAETEFYQAEIKRLEDELPRLLKAAEASYAQRLAQKVKGPSAAFERRLPNFYALGMENNNV